jgi:hypothetical protein
MPAVLLAARLLIGTTFLAAVVGKLAHGNSFGRFAAAMFGRRARSATVATLVAETAVVFLLLNPWGRGAGVAAGFGGALLLLAAFSAVLGVALRRQVRISCGCFGVSGAPPAGWHLARNGVLAAVAAAGLAGSLTVAPATVSTESVAAGTLGVALAVVVVALDEIRALFVPSKAVRG